MALNMNRPQIWSNKQICFGCISLADLMRLTLARKLEAVKRETVIKRKINPRVCLATPIQADKEGMDDVGDRFCRLSSSEVFGIKSELELDAPLPRIDELRVVIGD